MHSSAFPASFFRGFSLVLITLIFICSAPIPGVGQKLTKSYTSAILDSGILYFIFPLDDFQEREEKSRLIFDISYLTSRDSATVNFSYFLSSAHPADSLTLRSGDHVSTCPARKLFMDIENHQKWHHRFTATIHLTDLAHFFQSPFPPEIIIATQDDHLIYRIRKNHWKKQGSIISSIIQIIQANS